MIDWSFNGYMWPFVLAVAIQLFALIRARYAFARPVGQYFLAFMTVLLIWSLIHILEYGSQNQWTARLAWFITSLVAPFLAPCVFLFILHVIGYGRRIPRGLVIGLMVYAVSIVVVGLSSHLHDWLYYDIHIVRAVPYTVVDWRNGPLAYLDLSVSTILPVVGAIFALHFSVQNYALLRRRAVMTAVATLLPVIGFVLYIFDGVPLEGYNPAPLLVTISSILFARSIRLDRLLDIIPIARHEVVEQMELGVIILDSKGDVADCNPAVARIFGIERMELLSQTSVGWRMLMPCLRDVQNGKVSEASFAMTGRHYRVNATRLRRGGQQGTVVLISDITLIKEAEATLRRSNEDLEKLVDRRTREQRELNQVLMAEIDERKRMEKVQRKLESKLRSKHRLEALGTFSGGIAHDFSNILFAISGYTETALAQRELSSKMVDWLTEINKAAIRGTSLIKQILTFSRDVPPQLSVVDCAGIIEEVARQLKSRCDSAGVRLELRLESCPPLAADATQIHQVLMNLATNAVQAMAPEGGLLHISLRAVEDTSRGGGPESLVWSEICVEDTGQGMEQAVQDRIFEPFFSTKEKKGGTGLGLAVVHGIVTSHGGRVSVESRLGEGTRFTVRLPLLTEELESEIREVFAASPGPGIKVLFVDDGQSLRSLAHRVLTPKGYAIETARTAEEAIITLEQHPPDVLVTDLDMPGMDGNELLSRLYRKGIQIPVVVLTGDAPLSLDGELKHHFSVRMLRKPVRMADLSHSINRQVQEMNED